MHLAVVEDHIEDVMKIKQELSKYANVTYETFEHIQPFLECCLSFDAIFLDIDMKEESGIVLAQQIRKKDKIIPIIFVSYHNEYINDCFTVHPFYFIRKDKLAIELKLCMDDLIPLLKNNQAIFNYTKNGKHLSMPAKEILYFTKLHNTCEIKLKDQSLLKVHITLKQIEEQGLFGFYKINNSVIVNFAHIVMLQQDASFMMDDGTSIEISRRKKENVSNAYQEYLRCLSYR